MTIFNNSTKNASFHTVDCNKTLILEGVKYAIISIPVKKIATESALNGYAADR
jgi:hypothetical protein